MYYKGKISMSNKLIGKLILDQDSRFRIPNHSFWTLKTMSLELHAQNNPCQTFGTIPKSDTRKSYTRI